MGITRFALACLLLGALAVGAISGFSRCGRELFHHTRGSCEQALTTAETRDCPSDKEVAALKTYCETEYSRIKVLEQRMNVCRQQTGIHKL